MCLDPLDHFVEERLRCRWYDRKATRHTRIGYSGCRVVPFENVPSGLCPVGVEGDGPAKAERNRHRRASNKGYLPIGFEGFVRRTRPWERRSGRRPLAACRPSRIPGW